MRASFENFNDEDNIKIKKECRVISMDVKALYLSMEWEEITTAVTKLRKQPQLSVKCR